jgi:hypothetical protein
MKALVGVYSALVVNGSLVADGTAASPVVFTSIPDHTAGGDTNGDADATKPSANPWPEMTVLFGLGFARKGGSALGHYLLGRAGQCHRIPRMGAELRRRCQFQREFR